jgi:hypothetical protein
MRPTDYHGEIGADFAFLGSWWARIVARQWEKTVDATMQTVKHEAERRS